LKKEGIRLAKPAYKSEKRKKELQRLKKQEEKRQKRFNKSQSPSSAAPDEFGNATEDAAEQSLSIETQKDPAVTGQ